MLRTVAFLAVGLGAGLTVGITNRNRRALIITATLTASVATGWLMTFAEGWSGRLRAIPYSHVLMEEVGLTLLAGIAVSMAIRLEVPDKLLRQLGRAAALNRPDRVPAALLAAAPDTLHRLRTRAAAFNRPERVLAALLAVALSPAGRIGIAITGGGTALRFFGLDHVGYTHWDEAFYVSTARLFASEPLREAWTQAAWYAPLAPSMAIAIGFHLFGDHPAVAIGTSAFFGATSVLLCYLLVLQTHSIRVAVSASTLLSLSEFAIMYSRMALSDEMFLAVILMSLLCIWRARYTGHARWYLLGGLSLGLLLNVKLDGPFMLIVASAWIGLELAIQVVRRFCRDRTVSWSLISAVLVGGAAMNVVAIALIVPYLLHVNDQGGLITLVVALKSPQPGTSLEIVRAYFTSFGMTATLLMACAGTAFAVWRHRPGDRLLLMYTLLFGKLLLGYTPYPRLALPLVLSICVLAAVAIDELAALLARLWAARVPQMTQYLGLLSIVALLEAVPIPAMLNLRTNGYQDAAAAARGLEPTGTVFIHTQPVLALYATGHAHSLEVNRSTAQALQAPGRKYLISDHTRAWDQRILDLYSENGTSLHLQERIPNPLYGEVLLQPAYPTAFARLADPPNDYAFILVYRSDGPLKIPESWSHQASG